MPVNIETYVTRIPLASTSDLETAVKQECVIQASMDKGRRLTAAFEAHNSVILIFQTAADNKLPG